jgi:hypothetical protein
MEISVLKNSIEQLKKMRDATYSQLDASVRLEFDEVITQLERACESEAKDVDVEAVSKRALVLIGSVVEIASNLADLVKALFGD